METKNRKKDRAKEEEQEKVVKKKEESTEKEEEKEEKKEKVLKRPTPPPQIKNAGQIRLIGFLIIIFTTLISWSWFNYIDPSTVEASYYLNNMPRPLLEFYQNGSMVPVYIKDEQKRINVYVQHRYESTTTSLKSSPVVLLIHGMSTNSFVFRKVIDGMVDPNHMHPLLVDLPCYGFSESLKTCSPEKIARALADVLDSLGVNRVHLLSYDTGAVVALHFYNQFPTRVHSISFSDPVIDLTKLSIYYNLLAYPVINKFYMSMITSGALSSPLYYYLKTYKESPLTLDEVKSYQYIFKFKDNVNRVIKVYQDTDKSFKAVYDLTVSKFQYSTGIYKLFMETSLYGPTYQSEFFREKFPHLDRIDKSIPKFSPTEEELDVYSINLAGVIDNSKGGPKRKPVEIKKSVENHGHSHDHGHDHSHGHGHSHDHGHGHGHGMGGFGIKF